MTVSFVLDIMNIRRGIRRPIRRPICRLRSGRRCCCGERQDCAGKAVIDHVNLPGLLVLACNYWLSRGDDRMGGDVAKASRKFL